MCFLSVLNESREIIVVMPGMPWTATVAVLKGMKSLFQSEKTKIVRHGSGSGTVQLEHETKLLSPSSIKYLVLGQCLKLCICLIILSCLD